MATLSSYEFVFNFCGAQNYLKTILILVIDMLLNCFAQPTLLNSSKTYLNLEEFQNAPILLCHKNALDKKVLPKSWSGDLYATKEVINEVALSKYTIKPASIQVLCPDKIYKINIFSKKDCPYKKKYIELTVITWDDENLMFLIKADNVINLLTDIITEDMEVFVKNKTLRNSIKIGIDVLYINDGVYHNKAVLKKFPSECVLGALVTLVRPRYVQGLFNEEQLPQNIVNCCADICCG